MTYPKEAKQALSRKVAEKYGIIEIFEGRQIEDTGIVYESQRWLHDDWHTICELCVKHGVTYVMHTVDPHTFIEEADTVFVMINGVQDKSFRVDYADCNEDPSDAERIARLLALAEVTV